MTKRNFNQLNDPRIALRKVGAYENVEQIRREIVALCRTLGWHDEQRGAFGKVIGEGTRAVIKPNFVLHYNQLKGGDLTPLVTNPLIIQAVTIEALKANPQKLVVGDAPIQACDFDALLEKTNLGEWAADLSAQDPRFGGIKDFRRTISVFQNGVRDAKEDLRPTNDYVLFDLAGESLLEEITTDRENFRVTCYNPKLLAQTHRRGRHQFLAARDIIEADTVINLPKLKTHKKSGITNALKNLIGINGNKEFLPHHRLGNPSREGDCYPEESAVKGALEYVYDRQNTTNSKAAARVYAFAGRGLQSVLHRQRDEIGLEGSWSGNATIWRTCLDLNRILLYGKPDATFGETVQRRVLHISDGIIAGQGDGPLASQSLALGWLTAGRSAAAMDLLGAYLLGYNPQKIALVRESFGSFKWRIAEFSAAQVELIGDLNAANAAQFLIETARNAEVIYPAGWRDAAFTES